MIPLRIIFLIVTFYTMIGVNYAATTLRAPITTPASVTAGRVVERERNVPDRAPNHKKAFENKWAPEHCPKGLEMKDHCDELQKRIPESERLKTDEEKKQFCVAGQKFSDCIIKFKSNCTETYIKDLSENISKYNKDFTSVPECNKERFFVAGYKQPDEPNVSGPTANTLLAVVIFMLYVMV